jgi:hypothetical protein
MAYDVNKKKWKAVDGESIDKRAWQANPTTFEVNPGQEQNRTDQNGTHNILYPNP